MSKSLTSREGWREGSVATDNKVWDTGLHGNESRVDVHSRTS